MAARSHATVNSSAITPVMNTLCHLFETHYIHFSSSSSSSSNSSSSSSSSSNSNSNNNNNNLLFFTYTAERLNRCPQVYDVSVLTIICLPILHRYIIYIYTDGRKGINGRRLE